MEVYVVLEYVESQEMFSGGADSTKKVVGVFSSRAEAERQTQASSYMDYDIVPVTLDKSTERYLAATAKPSSR